MDYPEKKYFAEVPGKHVLTEAEQAQVLAGTWRGRDNTPRPGELIETVTTDRTGRKISEFRGDKSIWMNPYKARAHLQVRINKNPKPIFLTGGRAK
jgi:hypothetical protein